VLPSERRRPKTPYAPKKRGRDLKRSLGLLPKDIARAEELANGEFIKASESGQDFRDHLARFPKGVTERMAQTKPVDIAQAWPAPMEPTGFQRSRVGKGENVRQAAV
jgi:hypothetical protein